MKTRLGRLYIFFIPEVIEGFLNSQILNFHIARNSQFVKSALLQINIYKKMRKQTYIY